MAVGSLLAVGALALFGLGSAWLVARLLASESRTFDGVLSVVRGALPALAPAAPTDPGTSNGGAQRLQWTTARSVLGNLPDPYNPALDAVARQRNDQKALQSEVGQAYQLTRQTLGYVPVVGQVITVLGAFVDFLGSLVPPSTGGFASLSPLARQRMVLYRLFAGIDRPSPYPSQRYDPRAEKPAVVGDLERSPARMAEYEAALRPWLRRFFVEQAILAEAYRVKNTADEAMLPALVIDLLIQGNEWPPPIEPVPLTWEEWQARRTDVARGYPIPYPQLDVSNPLTRKVYDEVASEFSADAARFAARIAAVAVPAEILELSRQWGSIPRLGGRAAPIPAPSRRADRF